MKAWLEAKTLSINFRKPIPKNDFKGRKRKTKNYLSQNLKKYRSLKQNHQFLGSNGQHKSEKKKNVRYIDEFRERIREERENQQLTPTT